MKEKFKIVIVAEYILYSINLIGIAIYLHRIFISAARLLMFG